MVLSHQNLVAGSIRRVSGADRLCEAVTNPCCANASPLRPAIAPAIEVFSQRQLCHSMRKTGGSTSRAWLAVHNSESSADLELELTSTPRSGSRTSQRGGMDARRRPRNLRNPNATSWCPAPAMVPHIRHSMHERSWGFLLLRPREPYVVSCDLSSAALCAFA